MTDLDQSKLFLEVIPRTMRTVRTEIRKIAGSEFTTPQYRLLAKITRESCSNQELAEWMGVTPPTMTNMIDKLVRRGLAVRKATPGDRRRVAISATAKGIARTQQIRGTVQLIFSRKIAQLPAARKRELLAGLNVLKELF